MTQEMTMIVALAKDHERTSAVLLEACTIIHDLCTRIEELEGQVAYLEAKTIR